MNHNRFGCKIIALSKLCLIDVLAAAISTIKFLWMLKMFGASTFGKSVASVMMLAMMTLSAPAATVSCVGTGNTFTIDTTPVSSCAAVATAGGPNNIAGNPANDPLFALLGPGLILLAKSDGNDGTNPGALTVTGSGTSAGTFSFDISSLVASLGNEYYNFVLAFKSGGPFKQISVWAAFNLGDGVESGDWSFTAKNGLSHANLYAFKREKTVGPQAVPLPAGGLLLIGAFGMLGVLRARKKTV